MMQQQELSISSKENVILFIATIASLFIFLKNFWLSDDAFIIFRSIEQFIHGNGPTWNEQIRVQTFTSPLWYAVLLIARVFIENSYILTLVISTILFLLMLRLVYLTIANTLNYIFFLSLLLSTNAVFDFTSSGLENSLAYTLMSYLIYLLSYTTQPKDISSRINKSFLVLGLLFITRHDFIVLFFPTLYLLFKQIKKLNGSNVKFTSLLCFSPIILWTIFSTFYYGFPVPNTAYAKLQTGISKLLLFQNGINYLKLSFYHDLLAYTLLIFLSVIALFNKLIKFHTALLIGILCYLLYIAYIGGDFMVGRFISYPVLIGFIIISYTIKDILQKKYIYLLLSTTLSYSIFFFHTPLNSPVFYSNSNWSLGVADERGYYFPYLSLINYFQGKDDALYKKAQKDQTLLAVDNQNRKIISGTMIGILGYKSSIRSTILDQYALTDPLLSHLKVNCKICRVGHYSRELPRGYIESLKNNQILIIDPKVAKFYKHLKLATQSKNLYSLKRLKAIWYINTNSP